VANLKVRKALMRFSEDNNSIDIGSRGSTPDPKSRAVHRPSRYSYLREETSRKGRKASGSCLPGKLRVSTKRGAFNVVLVPACTGSGLISGKTTLGHISG
jgi:hypothetical protein